MDEFRSIAHIGFSEHIGPVFIHGKLADIQMRAYGLAAVTFGQVEKNFSFPSADLTIQIVGKIDGFIRKSKPAFYLFGMPHASYIRTPADTGDDLALLVVQ